MAICPNCNGDPRRPHQENPLQPVCQHCQGGEVVTCRVCHGWGYPLNDPRALAGQACSECLGRGYLPRCAHHIHEVTLGWRVTRATENGLRARCILPHGHTGAFDFGNVNTNINDLLDDRNRVRLAALPMDRAWRVDENGKSTEQWESPREAQRLRREQREQRARAVAVRAAERLEQERLLQRQIALLERHDARSTWFAECAELLDIGKAHGDQALVALADELLFAGAHAWDQVIRDGGEQEGVTAEGDRVAGRSFKAMMEKAQGMAEKYDGDRGPRVGPTRLANAREETHRRFAPLPATNGDIRWGHGPPTTRVIAAGVGTLYLDQDTNTVWLQTGDARRWVEVNSA